MKTSFKEIFYFSPKIDAFQDCLIESGITYNIMKILRKYNKIYIIVTKGKTPPKNIAELLIESRELVQILSSCSMPNEEVRKVVEPGAAKISERKK